MEINYKNEENLYTDYVLKEAKSSKQRITKICIMSFFVIAIFGMLMFNKYNYDITNYGYLKSGASMAMIMYVVCAVLWLIVLPMLQKRVDSMILISQGEEMGQAFEENVKIFLDEDNIIKETEYYNIKNTWKQVICVDEVGELIVIKIKGCNNVLVPISTFKEEEDKLKFIEFIKNKIVVETKTEEVSTETGSGKTETEEASTETDAETEEANKSEKQEEK